MIPIAITVKQLNINDDDRQNWHFAFDDDSNKEIIVNNRKENIKCYKIKENQIITC
jgi:hypothetical protein